MKKYIWILFLFIHFGLSAQVNSVVKWNYEISKIDGNEYEAILTATIDDGWHLYSKDLPEDSGIPTEMKISSKDIITIGNFHEEGKQIKEYSKAFESDLVYYEKQAKFIQNFKLKNEKKSADVTAEIIFQVCNDRVCLAPETLEFKKNSHSNLLEKPQKIQLNNDNFTSIKIESLDTNNPLTNECGINSLQENSENGLIFLLGFLGGFIALLTPCVFPMIPLTVSFFTKTGTKGKKNAIIYAFFIFIIFTILSLPFHIIDGISGNIFNDISTNIWLNLFFFAIFIFFAFSFFGYFDIVLPSFIVNKSSKAENAGGVIGIFFMALTLVIVSFSCTGPILGSLLGSVASSAKNVPTLLSFALAGFGLSWAVIFGLLAVFPQILQSLPKSGNWMNSLKVVLGFIEVALALKFLSKADLVSKTFLLKREIFIGLWILISIGLVLYLFGKIKFPHDNKTSKIYVSRKFLGITGIIFIIYLIPGIFPSEKSKLSLLSGILPPMNISIYKSEKDGILGLKPEHDYFKALEIAKKENKPILVDFTGYGCENCRKMEEFVWSKEDILPLLQNEVILASLYIDDREKLPESEQISIDLGNGATKKIRTIGDKWSMFQQVNFFNNSQPHYVLITPNQEIINTPVSGYMQKEEFKKFLECGIKFYTKNSN